MATNPRASSAQNRADSGDWGWALSHTSEDEVQSETDATHPKITGATTSPRQTPPSPGSGSNSKVAMSPGRYLPPDTKVSVQKGITSSPSFQELEKAIGATLAQSMTVEAESGQATGNSGEKQYSPSRPGPSGSQQAANYSQLGGYVSNPATQSKWKQQQRRQQMQLQRQQQLQMNFKPPPLTMTPLPTSKEELSPYIVDTESRALILFHSPYINPVMIRDACQKFGVLYYIRPEFHSKGVTLLSYFDLRSAQQAMAGLAHEIEVLVSGSSTGTPQTGNTSAKSVSTSEKSTNPDNEAETVADLPHNDSKSDLQTVDSVDERERISDHTEIDASSSPIDQQPESDHSESLQPLQLPQSTPPSASVNYSLMLHVSNNSEECSLFIRNVPITLAAQELRAVVARFGDIKSLTTVTEEFIANDSSNSDISVGAPNPATSTGSAPGFVTYAVEFFNMQDTKAAASELSAISGISSQHSFPSWMLSAQVAFVPQDSTKQKLCRQLLQLLSKWRIELANTSPYGALPAAYHMTMMNMSPHHMYNPLRAGLNDVGLPSPLTGSVISLTQGTGRGAGGSSSLMQSSMMGAPGILYPSIPHMHSPVYPAPGSDMTPTPISPSAAASAIIRVTSVDDMDQISPRTDMVLQLPSTAGNTPSVSSQASSNTNSNGTSSDSQFVAAPGGSFGYYPYGMVANPYQSHFMGAMNSMNNMNNQGWKQTSQVSSYSQYVVNIPGVQGVYGQNQSYVNVPSQGQQQLRQSGQGPSAQRQASQSNVGYQQQQQSMHYPQQHQQQGYAYGPQQGTYLASSTVGGGHGHHRGTALSSSATTSLGLMQSSSGLSHPQQFGNQQQPMGPANGFPPDSSRPQHHNGGHNPSAMSRRPGMSSMTSAGPQGSGSYAGHAVNPSATNIVDQEYVIDKAKLLDGTETRTTIMIRNIPNKYKQQMLLEEVNVNHMGTYDFFYLPIDFKNKCNVGYGFINFLSTSYILPFLQEFEGARWKNFNSEKVCSITYARIQGKAAMVARFQNSSLLDKDNEYKPLLFYSSGPEMGLPEPFPTRGGSRPMGGVGGGLPSGGPYGNGPMYSQQSYQQLPPQYQQAYSQQSMSHPQPHIQSGAVGGYRMPTPPPSTTSPPPGAQHY